MKFAVYFLTACIIIAYIIPFITTLIKKSLYYLKIKCVCNKNKYKLISSFLNWLFSSVRNNEPEMFIKTDKAIYSVKNYGFYKNPNYFVIYNKNNIEIQIIRMILWIGYAYIKNIKTKTINYESANKYFKDSILPIINIMVFCPKCAGLCKLEGESAIYSEYVNSQYAFKIFGNPIAKIKSIQANPYTGFTKYEPIPQMNSVKAINLSNGDMIHSAYVYNVKSFIKQRLQSSDSLVNSFIEEERRKFETRDSYKI